MNEFKGIGGKSKKSGDTGRAHEKKRDPLSPPIPEPKHY